MNHGRTFAAAAAALMAAGGLCTIGGMELHAQARPAAHRTLDVAGVTITMSVPEAVAALRRAGWSVSRGVGRSWAGSLDEEVARQKGANAGWHPVEGEGDVRAVKADEGVGITVRPSARGGEVETVSYSAPFAGRSAMEMGKALFERYGPSTKGRASATGFYLTWCSPSTCGPDAMKLTADTGGSENRLKLTLFWSLDQHLAYDRMVGEAVRARSGGGGRPSF